MENFISEFIKEVKDALIRENEGREYDDKKQLNVPFMISVLEQHLGNEDFVNFLYDLENNEHSLYYEDIYEDYFDYGKLSIRFYDGNDYTYSIAFGYDARDWGYCQCEKTDKDYRDDKKCCGHGCDWWAPAFSIEKNISLGGGSWNGDQHDYWEFEDDFYKSDKELAEAEEKRNRENKIKNLQEGIESMQKQLSELLYL